MKSNNLNKVQLIGHLGAAPKTIEAKNGQSFVCASLATNEPMKLNGEWKTAVQWHQLLFFGKLTKVAEFLDKASHIYVEGRLRYNQWTDANGNIQRQVHIIVSNVEFLGQSKSRKEASDKDEGEAINEMNDVAERNLSDMYAMLSDADLSESAPF